MQNPLISIVIVIFLLAAGYISGKRSNPKLKNHLVSSISSVVLLLLFFMGIDFGAVFTQREVGYQIIKGALLFSTTIVLFTYFFLYKKDLNISKKNNSLSFFSPLKGCLKAITSFALGVIVFKLTSFNLEDVNFSSSYILYLLIYLVGVDLVGLNILRLNREIIYVPIITILSTITAVFVFSTVSNFSWRELLVVSSGFGWFSLSGPMVNKLVSPEMGAMAFMTDFFREMFSIIFLYFLGKKQPASAIGISGAAAMDSALPFIKENCDKSFISHAIVSGFILTILAPLFISLSVTILR